ncbi:MAG TPA: DUF4397 domain-containing protein [Chthonomonadaceae bacterium]|nr:DUF4397 domain-containing protein [Chthonomonadaceae bacterium]
MGTRKHLLLAGSGLACVLALGLAGCSSDNSIGPSANTTSNVRVFNALSGVSGNAVTVTQRTTTATPMVNSLNYGQSTGYFLAPAGNGITTYVLQSGTQTVITSGSVTLHPHNTGQNTGTSTIILAGIAGQPSPNNPQILQFQDGWPNNVPANQSAIRFINAAVGSPPLTLNNNASGTLTPLPNQQQISYTQSSFNPNYFNEPSGPYNFVVTDNAGHQWATLPGQNLTSGLAYTVIVYGVYNSPLSIVVLTDTNSQ